MSENYSNKQQDVLHLLKLLNDNGVLPYIIIAGSWAEYVYSQANVLPGFSLSLRTLDIDFLIKNIRKPVKPISILGFTKGKNGYIVEHDYLQETTKITTPGGLEVEFLVNQLGSGSSKVLETNLGVNAQALRHMEHIIKNAITVDLFGMNAQVPCPESYVLHKMLINDVRGSKKKVKDREAITRLLPYINFEKLSFLYQEFTKKEKSRINKFIQLHGEEVCNELPLDKKIKFTTLATNDVFTKNSQKIQTPTIHEDR